MIRQESRTRVYVCMRWIHVRMITGRVATEWRKRNGRLYKYGQSGVVELMSDRTRGYIVLKGQEALASAVRAGRRMIICKVHLLLTPTEYETAVRHFGGK